jgi:hypothetical protein
MTRILAFFLFIILFASCGTDTKPAQQSTAPAVNPKTNSTPLPFAGSWISASYLRSITDQQSPRKAQEGSEECFIQLPSTTLLPTTMAINFHEGLSDLVPINNNGTYQLWEKQNDTLSRSLYTLESISPDSIKIGDKLFVKINLDITGNEPRILEEILFKGKYQSKQGDQVEFKNNGEVSGLGKYKYYEPVIDYFDAGLQIDQVALGETRENMKPFGFKFKQDRLELYELKCKTYDNADKRCVEVEFGNKTIALHRVE